ncbi:hypothetical protein A8H39_01040 [Paraburkholderia fungorum]|nr:hypothetical protein A8H39_01040 [Paraburkholderia fungorum]
MHDVFDVLLREDQFEARGEAQDRCTAILLGAASESGSFECGASRFGECDHAFDVANATDSKEFGRSAAAAARGGSTCVWNTKEASDHLASPATVAQLVDVEGRFCRHGVFGL